MTLHERRLIRILALYALFLLALHLLVSQLPLSWAFFWYPQKLVGPGGRLAPAEWLWGLYPYTYAARWLQFFLAATTAILTVWLGFGRQMTIAAPPFPRRRRWQLLIAALSWPLFWFGRTVHTRWGDAYILVKGIAHPDVRLTYNWQAPLDTYLHAKLFRVGESLWQWSDALPAYWILSSLAGVIAVWVLLQLAEAIGRTNLERWVIFGVMITLGSVQLFFGYPENYTWISLGMLIFFWLGWRFLQGEGSIWAPSIVLAISQGFHPATLFLQPALWFLAWWGWRRRARSFWEILLAVILPSTVVLIGVIALMTAGGHGLAAFLGPEAPGGGDHRWWVPFTQPQGDWEYYTMFSRGHLMDILNEQWLTQPFTLLSLALILLFHKRAWPRDAFSRFMMLATAALLFLIFTWNPDYGGQRDWDLFSIAAWPSTLLMVYWLTRSLGELALFKAGGLLIANQLLYSAIWIYSNTRPWDWPT